MVKQDKGFYRNKGKKIKIQTTNLPERFNQ